MSTAAFTTLEDRASGDSTPVLDPIHGSARAWVNFDGTGTVAIRDDYNVDSITDTGTGVYTVNFTSALSSANYAASSEAGQGGGKNAITNNYAAGSVDVQTQNPSTFANQDYDTVCAIVIGDPS